MKKKLFLMSAIALTLASCSQEDVLDFNRNLQGNDGVISFRARTSKSTRAQDITTESLNEFNVFALKGCVDDLTGNQTLPEFWKGAETFRLNEETGYFESETPHYYPTDSHSISFTAYAPTSVADVSVNGQGELSIPSFTVNDDITKQVDLIVADCPGNFLDKVFDNEYDGALPLDFVHALSKVYVSAAMNSNSEYTYKVAGVKFGNIMKSGRYLYNDFDRGADGTDGEELNHQWFPVNNELGDLEVIFDEPIEIDGDTPLMDGFDEKGSFLMIPQQLKSKIVTNDDNDPEYNNVISYSFEEGVSYIALLINIMYNKPETGVNYQAYPYLHGEVDKISQEIDGVKYAWAAFPIGSPWTAGKYIDYKVDFSKGAGFVPPGAGDVQLYIDGQPQYEYDEDGNQIGPTYVNFEYKPILGDKIIFTESVGDWNQGDENTVDQQFEGVVNCADMEDPF